ncbi:g6f-like [Notolabrus celidotus]|uniref:g6f-like n=1 Tax=Notolabrus celidotus TaxID=1203425 RepID=UPI00148FC54E|nr:g6f-like [Notolabrus celidotus]
MESRFLTFVCALSFAAFSSQFGIPDWDDLVVVREGMPTTLVCTDNILRGAVAINWLVKPAGGKDWKLVLSANERKEFSGRASKASMRLTDPNFQDSGNYSLFLLPKMEDSGYYSCLIKQQKWKLKERIILLAVLTVTIEPAVPILQMSTLRLTASVNPALAITKITWMAPGNIPMKSESTKKGIKAKLPRMQSSDKGAYVCEVHPLAKSSIPLYRFNVDVTVADEVLPADNITYADLVSTATQAGTPVPLTCHVDQGDYVKVFWKPPDIYDHLRLVYQYDRWRGSIELTEKRDRLQPAGSPYNADTGSFSFLLTPWLNDGGLYSCDVYIDDHAYSQRTQLTVLKVAVTNSSKGLELKCIYNERTNVRSAKWKHQNKGRELNIRTKSPGSIFIILPLPITSDTAGEYTCVLQLVNGQTVSAKHVVSKGRTGGKVSQIVACVLIFFTRSVLYHLNMSPSRFSVSLLEIMNHECGCFSDMCFMKHFTGHSSQPQANSSAWKSDVKGVFMDKPLLNLPTPHSKADNEKESVPPPTLLPSLSALLLLVPLVAAAVGVLLWRQKHISDRGIEPSLSVYSGEVENIYENPEDTRQAPPQGSVYMDLKPRGEDDVYKELERCEQCQG